jgi:hypothetical protein
MFSYSKQQFDSQLKSKTNIFLFLLYEYKRTQEYEKKKEIKRKKK